MLSSLKSFWVKKSEWVFSRGFLTCSGRVEGNFGIAPDILSDVLRPVSLEAMEPSYK